MCPMRVHGGLRRRSVVAAVALTASVPVLALAPAQPPATPASTGIEPWLQRIQQAAASINYQGTLASNAGGAYSSSRVLHYGDGRQTYERL